MGNRNSAVLHPKPGWQVEVECPSSVETMGPSFESFGIWIEGLDDRGGLNFEREEPGAGALSSVHFQVPG